jgi:hypothetical protein
MVGATVILHNSGIAVMYEVIEKFAETDASSSSEL